MPEKYGKNTLFHAIYMDEMGFQRQRKAKCFSVQGWVPVLLEDPSSKMHDHIQLLFAASPDIGLIHFEIVTGGVNGNTVLEFCKATCEKYLKEFVNGTKLIKRAFIWDNVRTHHVKAIEKYFSGNVVSQHLALEFLPPYSPFLNPVEEVFSLIKFKFFHAVNNSKQTPESRAAITKILAEEVLNVTREDIFFFYVHTLEFINMSLREETILSQQHYEQSHKGDEHMMRGSISEEVELLLNSYLPESYKKFTPSQNKLLEQRFNVKRLTKEMVDAFGKDCKEAEPHVREAV